MTYPVSLVEWESRFFGFPVGSVEIPADYSPSLLEESMRIARQRFRVIYMMLQDEGPETLLLDDVPARCYDRRLTMKKAVPDNVPSLDSRVRSYTSTFCTPMLERLAILSGTMTRFSRDPELSTQFERLFLTWINYAVSGGMTDSIWTWYEESQHVGLVTIRCAQRIHPKTGELEKEGRLGMLAVDPKFRRRGIGTQLFEASDFWCSALGIPTASIVTQKDTEATIACTQLGFHQTSSETIYHYWSPGWLYDFRRGWLCRKAQQ